MTTRFINSFYLLALLLLLSGCSLQNYTLEDPNETLTSTPIAINPVQATKEISVSSQETAIVVIDSPPNTIEDTDPPLMLVSLKNQTLHFECLDRKNCISDVKLQGHVLFDSPFHLSRVYYWNPESLYIILASNSTIPEKMNIIHFNPQTREIRSILSPDAAEFSLVNVADGYLVLARYQGQTINIIGPDLSVAEVNVGMEISKMIINGDKIVALNQLPFEDDDQIFVDVSVLDIKSQQAKSERLKLTGLETYHDQLSLDASKDYLMFIEGVSRDLDNLYVVYKSGAEPNIDKLGAFSVAAPSVIITTQGDVSSTGYDQYHEMLYTEYSKTHDGGSGASLYNMESGNSILDLVNSYPNWVANKLKIVPFGDDILIDNGNAVIQLSPTGEIMEIYNIPAGLINQDYQVVRFEI